MFRSILGDVALASGDSCVSHTPSVARSLSTGPSILRKCVASRLFVSTWPGPSAREISHERHENDEIDKSAVDPRGSAGGGRRRAGRLGPAGQRRVPAERRGDPAVHVGAQLGRPPRRRHVRGAGRGGRQLARQLRGARGVRAARVDDRRGGCRDRHAPLDPKLHCGWWRRRGPSGVRGFRGRGFGTRHRGDGHRAARPGHLIDRHPRRLDHRPPVLLRARARFLGRLRRALD